MRYTFPTTLRLVWFLENGRLTSAWRLIEDEAAETIPPSLEVLRAA
jgi:hypothetical protein